MQVAVWVVIAVAQALVFVVLFEAWRTNRPAHRSRAEVLPPRDEL